MTEQEFRWGWKVICAAYIKESHAFTLGCGRKTLAYWIAQATEWRHKSPNYWRQILMEAVSRGWATMGFAGDYRTFTLKFGVPKTKKICLRCGVLRWKLSKQKLCGKCAAFVKEEYPEGYNPSLDAIVLRNGFQEVSR